MNIDFDRILQTMSFADAQVALQAAEQKRKAKEEEAKRAAEAKRKEMEEMQARHLARKPDVKRITEIANNALMGRLTAEDVTYIFCLYTMNHADAKEIDPRVIKEGFFEDGSAIEIMAQTLLATIKALNITTIDQFQALDAINGEAELADFLTAMDFVEEPSTPPTPKPQFNNINVKVEKMGTPEEILRDFINKNIH